MNGSKYKDIQAWWASGNRESYQVALGAIEDGLRDVQVWTKAVDPPGLGMNLDPPVITFLHAFPTSSFDFSLVLDRLAREPDHEKPDEKEEEKDLQRGVSVFSQDSNSMLAKLGMRLLFIDLLGYGNSDKGIGEARFSVDQQASLVVKIWERHVISKTHLVVHDLSASVCMDLLGREARGNVSGVELGKVMWLNGNVFPDFYRPLNMERVLANKGAGWAATALMSRSTVEALITPKFAPKHPCDPKVLDQMYQGVQNHGGLKILHKLARYAKDARRHKYVWQGGLELAMRRDPNRMMFYWGMMDPVCGVDMCKELHRRFDRYSTNLIQEQADLGHWPQLEDPERVAAALVAHFGSEPWKTYLPTPKPFEVDIHIQIQRSPSRRSSIQIRRYSGDGEVYSRRGPEDAASGLPTMYCSTGGMNHAKGGGMERMCSAPPGALKFTSFASGSSSQARGTSRGELKGLPEVCEEEEAGHTAAETTTPGPANIYPTNAALTPVAPSAPSAAGAPVGPSGDTHMGEGAGGEETAEDVSSSRPGSGTQAPFVCADASLPGQTEHVAMSD